MLKEDGAKEVHMRISSPPYKYPCFFGIDTSTRKQLVASMNSIEDIRELTGADSLGYLSLEGLLESVHGSKCGFCTACFDGDYPIEVPFETVSGFADLKKEQRESVLTAIGAFGGSLKTVPVVKLGSLVMKEVLKKAGLRPVANDEMAPEKLKGIVPHRNM